MPYIEKSKYIFDCKVCHTRCDGVSKGSYIFESDVVFAEKYENLIIDKINASGKYIASKCEEAGYPDIRIEALDGKLHSYLEVKVQRRTFMSVVKNLPFSKLEPSETMVLNLSDLLRYFKIQEETQIPTSIVWAVLNRPCILNAKEQRFYFQKIDKLRVVYQQNGDNRRFRRDSGDGDVVNGIHKGVTVNYHFSLNELTEWMP